MMVLEQQMDDVFLRRVLCQIKSCRHSKHVFCVAHLRLSRICARMLECIWCSKCGRVAIPMCMHNAIYLTKRRCLHV